MKYTRVDQLDLKDSHVFLRTDLNVPLKDGVIQDDTRIKAALPTIQHILKQTSRLCIASHLGRPEGKYTPEYSLAPIGERLAELLGKEVLLMQDYDKEPIDQVLRQLGKNQIVLLENLRFYKGEKKNDPSFAENLIKGMGYYVNDAFGAAHRSHASIVACADLMPKTKKALGFLIDNEIKALEKLKEGTAPFTVIIGGSKVSDKIGVILNLLNYCNNLIIGGAMAYTFLKFKGHKIGASKVEHHKEDLIKAIYDKAQSHNVRIYIPCDHVASESIESENPHKIKSKDIPDNLMGLDIGPNTITDIRTILKTSQTVFWNGPLGVFEKKEYSEGTRAVANAIAYLKAYTVVGGGDSLAAINQEKLSENFSHISTGGGASLEYIEGKNLPGLKVLEN